MKRLAMLGMLCSLMAPTVKMSRAVAGAKPTAGPTEENALDAEKELGQAMRTNDADAFCRLLDPDWAVVDGNGNLSEGPAMGDGKMRDAVCAAMKSGDWTRNTYDMDLANARVRVYGNLATVTFKLSVAGPAAKYAATHKTWSVKEVQTDVLKWEDGAWRSILTHETNVKGTLRTE